MVVGLPVPPCASEDSFVVVNRWCGMVRDLGLPVAYDLSSSPTPSLGTVKSYGWSPSGD